MPTARIYTELTRKLEAAQRNRWRFLSAVFSITTSLSLIDNVYGEQTNYAAGKALFVLLFLYVFAALAYYIFRAELNSLVTEKPKRHFIKTAICNLLLLIALAAIGLGLYGGK